jgi:hypothetical protein
MSEQPIEPKESLIVAISWIALPILVALAGALALA